MVIHLGNKWDLIAEYWKENLPDMKDWQMKERLDFASNVKGRVLDVGCGTGRDMEIFNGLGLDCVGIDYSERMEGLSVDMTSLPFNDKTFDGVWSCSAMKYLNDDDMLASLKEINRVMKDDGFLWLGLEKGDGEIERELYGEKFTIRLYDENSISSLLNKAGLSIIHYEAIAAWRQFINFWIRKCTTYQS